MSTVKRYMCELLFNNTELTIFAENQRISVDEAATVITNITNEVKYSITVKRIRELRELLNPSHIGIRQGAEAKRKYVRKNVQNIEVVDPVVVPNIPPVIKKELYGLIVPIGTIIFTIPNSASSRYEVVTVTNEKSLILRMIGQKGAGTPYPISTLNAQLYGKQWNVENPTPEIIQKINSYSNVVDYKDFKQNSSKKGTNNEFSVNTNYVIPIGGPGSNTTIPVTPGFTGNCQLSIIGLMSTLIQVSTNLQEQLKQIYKKSSRKLLLCDVRSETRDQLKKKLPASSIYSEMPYTSTNGSRMVIVLINLTQL